MPGQNDFDEWKPDPTSEVEGGEIDPDDIEEAVEELAETERASPLNALRAALAADPGEGPNDDLQPPKTKELVRIRMYLRAIALYLRDLSRSADGYLFVDEDDSGE